MPKHLSLKLLSALFHFFFHQMIALKKTEKCFLLHPKSSFPSGYVQIFVIFYLPFHTFPGSSGQIKVPNKLADVIFGKT